jgi:hypothetical protein
MTEEMIPSPSWGPQVTDFAGCSNFVVVALVSFLCAQTFYLRQVRTASTQWRRQLGLHE